MSIEINQIPYLLAINLLKNYNGKNPYLLKLKNDKNLKLTSNQIEYIKNFHNVEPIKINKIIEITDYLANSLKEKYGLKILPKRIYVSYLLAETEKSYHITGKLIKNQKYDLSYWLPKTQVINDLFFEVPEINFDITKYEKIDKLKRKAYNYQIFGIKFLLSRNKCILADDMGLGKTYQSIIAALESGAKKILIISPASLKINWKREIENFTNEVEVVNGRDWKTSKFTIINYEILKNFHRVFRKKEDRKLYFSSNRIVSEGFDLIIIDEAHYIKNPKSQRSKIILDIILNYGIKKVWLLTGTPISNRPMDYFNLLKTISSPIANNWVYYAKRYCEGRKFYRKLKNGRKKLIWLTDGASNLDELHKKTKNIILRRLKNDILDLPEKIKIPLYYQLTDNEKNDYNNLWEEYIEERRREKKSINIQRDLVELTLLRKFMAMTSIKKTISLTENAIEEGHKVVIFTTFTDELLSLYSHFKNISVYHYGGLSQKEKQFAVDEFQNNDKIKVFVGNIKSAGVGITLTAGDILIFNSLSYVPSELSQAEDRLNRIGQKNKVTIYYQIFEDTISEIMWGIINKKQDIIDKIIKPTGLDYKL